MASNIEKANSLPLSTEEVARIVAETRRTNAEADKMTLEVQLAAITLEKAHEELLSARAARHEAQAKADMTHLDAIVKQRNHDETLAKDEYNQVYWFTDPIKASTVDHCRDRLTKWHRINKDAPCDIELIFSSPGGDLFDGMLLFDFIKTLRTAGHKITTGSLGKAASMAGVLLQAGETRWMGREGYILIHEVATALAGKQGELKDEMALLEKMSDHFMDIYAERSALAVAAVPEVTYNGVTVVRKKMTKADIKKKIAKTDWWLDSREALTYGFVDSVK